MNGSETTCNKPTVILAFRIFGGQWDSDLVRNINILTYSKEQNPLRCDFPVVLVISQNYTVGA